MSMRIGVIGPGLTKSAVVKVSPVGTPTFVDSQINGNRRCNNTDDMQFDLKQIDAYQSIRRGSPTMELTAMLSPNPNEMT